MSAKLRNRVVMQGAGISLTPAGWLWLVVCCLLMLRCSPNADTAATDTYTCPMHPTVVSDQQGVCPVCQMDLVRKARPGEEIQMTEDLARLLKSPNETVVSQIKTTRGTYQSMPGTIAATGVVTYDTRQVSTIPVRMSGRLEKVFVHYLFQPIKKGMKVAEIYSPELVTAQQELLYLLNQQQLDETLLAAGKSRLRLLGFTDQQLHDLLTTRVVQDRFSVFSDQPGYVVPEAQPAPVAPPPTGMGMAPPAAPMPAPPFIREGNYVTAGQTLFTVVNTAALRIELNVTPAESRLIQLGDSIVIIRNTQGELKTRIEFIQPFYEPGQEFVTVRVQVANANLKIGELVGAHLITKATEALWIPRAALVDLGLEQVVFVKNRGTFSARRVDVQRQTADQVAVRGLSSSDEIAMQAQFLMDSEGFIKRNN